MQLYLKVGYRICMVMILGKIKKLYFSDITCHGWGRNLVWGSGKVDDDCVEYEFLKPLFKAIQQNSPVNPP